MMILSLDNLAHRYNCLPGEALSRASTFDLYVLDVSAKWVKYQQELADGKATKKQPTQQQMLDMVAKVREKNNG
jgi:hypothetical protein